MLGTSKQNPVIGPLNLETTRAYAQLLRDGVIDWISGKEWEMKTSSLMGARDPLDEWHKKFADAGLIINSIESGGRRDRGPGRPNGFVYMFNSLPIGIMTILEFPPTDVYIDGIVASPAANGAGCALIEAAVRWSERSGCSGNISLNAHNAAVSKIYLGYGFQSSSIRDEPAAGEMKLNPMTSDVWEKTGDGWSLKAKIGRAYAVSGLA